MRISDWSSDVCSSDLPRRCPLYQDLKQGGTPAGIEYYLPLFFDAGSTQSLFDYLGANTLVVIASNAFDAADGFWGQTAERYEQRRHDLERPVLPPDELFLAPDALRSRLNTMARIEWCPPGHPRHGEAHRLGEQPAPNLPLAQKGEPAAALRSFQIGRAHV